MAIVLALIVYSMVSTSASDGIWTNRCIALTFLLHLLSFPSLSLLGFDNCFLRRLNVNVEPVAPYAEDIQPVQHPRSRHV